MVLNDLDDVINRWVRQADHDLDNAKKNHDIEAYDVWWNRWLSTKKYPTF